MPDVRRRCRSGRAAWRRHSGSRLDQSCSRAPARNARLARSSFWKSCCCWRPSVTYRSKPGSNGTPGGLRVGQPSRLVSSANSIRADPACRLGCSHAWPARTWCPPGRPRSRRRAPVRPWQRAAGTPSSSLIQGRRHELFRTDALGVTAHPQISVAGIAVVITVLYALPVQVRDNPLLAPILTTT